jgi:hypothetical protein
MFFAYIPAGTGFPGVPGPPITAPPQPRSRVDRNPAAVFRAAVNGYVLSAAGREPAGLSIGDRATFRIIA